jgi:4-amino-4-deoxy-L-arabinose transferase-like glycosyltransferase
LVNPRSRLTDWVLLLAVCIFFFLWGLSSFGLVGADEPRYAQVAREMLARHDWVTPTLGGNAWLEKPPLYYWQAVVAYRLFGVSDWAARLPSACDAFLLVLAVFWFLRRFRPGFALDGALMLATAAGIVGYARAASTDMPLAAAFAIAMLAWYAWFESGDRKFLVAFYALIALGMLAKGPVAPFLAAVIITIFAVSQREIGIAWKTLWLPGIVLFCAVGLPWYVMAQLRNPQFVRVFILEHNLARFGSNLYHHPQPFWYYVPVTLLAWAPWSVFAIAAIVWAVRRFSDRDTNTLSTFLVLWIGTTVAFFSISKSKLPGYVLPAIPPGIVLMAEYMRERMMHRLGWILASMHTVLSAALMFSALMIQYILLQHRVPWNGAAAWPLLVAATIGTAMGVLLLKSGYGALRVATLVPAVIALALVVKWGAPLLDETLSERPVANALSQLNSHNMPVGVFLVPREVEFGLQFYRDQAIARYELGQVPDGEHLLVAAQGFQQGAAKVAGRRVIYLGQFASQKLEYFYVPAR